MRWEPCHASCAAPGRRDGHQRARVEQPAPGGSTGQRLLAWVTRHWLWGSRAAWRGVQQTGGYCWRTYYHATELRLLLRILLVPGPSMMAYAKHNFRHLGVRQQYPGVNRAPGWKDDFDNARHERRLLAVACTRLLGPAVPSCPALCCSPPVAPPTAGIPKVSASTQCGGM